MSASGKNVNLQHGPKTRRDRLRRQHARSNYTAERSETEIRSSRSEDATTTNGTLTGNRFAALSHTVPAPGMNPERIIHPIRTDFTFRCRNPCPTAAGTAAAFEDLQPANSCAKGERLVLQPVAISPKRRQSDPDLVPLLLAELTVTASLQEIGSHRIPATPPPTPPSEISKLFAQSTATELPLDYSTKTLLPESIDASSPSSLRASDPQNGILSPLLLSTLPLIPSFPLTPPRQILPPKPTVHLPPTRNTIPIHETTTPGASAPASDPTAHSLPSADTSSHAGAAENTPEPPKESLEAISVPAERNALEGAQFLDIDRSKCNEESFMDDASEGGSDGEWELVG